VALVDDRPAHAGVGFERGGTLAVAQAIELWRWWTVATKRAWARRAVVDDR